MDASAALLGGELRVSEAPMGADDHEGKAKHDVDDSDDSDGGGGRRAAASDSDDSDDPDDGLRRCGLRVDVVDGVAASGGGGTADVDDGVCAGKIRLTAEQIAILKARLYALLPRLP